MSQHVFFYDLGDNMFSSKFGNLKLVVSIVGSLFLLPSIHAYADCDLVSTKTGKPLNIKATEEDSADAKEFLKTCINPYTKKYIENPKLADAKPDKEPRNKFLAEKVAAAVAKNPAMTAEQQAEIQLSEAELLKFDRLEDAGSGGKRLFGLKNCSGCHGGKLEGVMAPALHKAGGNDIYDGKWAYAKHSTDKGIFETISGGGSDSSVSNRGVMPTFHSQVEGHLGDGLTTDDILKLIAYVRLNYRGDGAKDWLK